MPQPLKFCEYELPGKAFSVVTCSRAARVYIDRNGCFCTQHATIVRRNLRQSGITRYVERIQPE